MAKLINQVVDVAVNEGITEVLVHEACPVDMESLHPEAKLIRGAKTFYFDESFVGIAFVGQGITGSVKKTKTYRPGLVQVRFNDNEVDEITIACLYAGHFGIPLLLAHGKPSAFRILKNFLPSLVIAEKNIKQVLRKGLKNPQKSQIATMHGRITVQFHFANPLLAEMHSIFPKVRRIDNCITSISSKDIKEALFSYCSTGLLVAADWLY